MRVLVLGATGGTGREVLARAVAAGHEVTVLVRHPERLPHGARDRVRVLVGDATDAAVMRDAVAGQDAVLNAIGSRDPRHPIEVPVTKALLAAEQEGVRRLVVCSAFGVGATRRDASALQRVFFATVLRRVYAAKDEADTAVRASDLDWTLVYPTRLTDADETGRIHAADQGRGVGRISRADVAAFMVQQLHSDSWSRKTVIITGTD